MGLACSSAGLLVACEARLLALFEQREQRAEDGDRCLAALALEAGAAWSRPEGGGHQQQQQQQQQQPEQRVDERPVRGDHSCGPFVSASLLASSSACY